MAANHLGESKPSMAGEDKSTVQYVESLCFLCNLSNVDFSCGMNKEEINYMLKFVLHRIRAWLPNTITHTMAQEDRPEWLTDTELTWRANQLFFEHRDMSVMEVKINTQTYTTFSEFLADVYSVQHNVAIFHSVESQEYGAAELMVRDAHHDINEMKMCIDCYKHSNEKLNAKWFCLPCRVPHKLVWAKQKGYPYWPAKVIKETATHCDVRFFGGKYERALLVKTLIKPIVVSKNSLQIKPSAAFNKAYEELQLHQAILKDPKELEKLLAQSKSPRQPKQNKSLLNLSNSSNPSTPQQKRKVGRPKSNTSAVASVGKRKASTSTVTTGVEEKRSKQAEEETVKPTDSPQISGNVIDISDAEEEDGQEYSFRDAMLMQTSPNLDEACPQVTSSTETFGKQLSPRQETDMHVLDQPYSDSVEKMRRRLEQLPNKAEIIKCAMECMQTEIDRITKEHNDHLKSLFESHNQQISETKKKQWCYNCEQDAIYHCCWNTAYCSQSCQQQHWQAEHKKVCRRKR
ncbi:unnamed protein product [Acanthoscelides obtectus]|nr:unnamed protein product [Acanthoscelides obtectus]CAK1659586.1 Zinc finger MYND domain-containing protein 11 [Acanthoscelides obtectus]